jgi:bifunctional hydroxylase/dehydrase
MRDLFAELMRYDVVAKHLVGMVSGLEISYQVGPGSHPLLGKRMPNRELIGGSGTLRTYQLLHSARGLLLDLTDDAPLRHCAAPWADRVDVVTARLSEVDGEDPLAGSQAVLVRPDGHIAWASPGAGELVGSALSRWFGAPSPTEVGR